MLEGVVSHNNTTKESIVAQKLKFVFRKLEKNVDKGEYAYGKHCCPLSRMFSTSFSSSLCRDKIVW